MDSPSGTTGFPVSSSIKYNHISSPTTSSSQAPATASAMADGLHFATPRPNRAQRFSQVLLSSYRSFASSTASPSTTNPVPSSFNVNSTLASPAGSRSFRTTNAVGVETSVASYIARMSVLRVWRSSSRCFSLRLRMASNFLLSFSCCSMILSSFSCVATSPGLGGLKNGCAASVSAMLNSARSSGSRTSSFDARSRAAASLITAKFFFAAWSFQEANMAMLLALTQSSSRFEGTSGSPATSWNKSAPSDQ
mmetsp:Transcript_23377/g.65543  ORF Transcript_23377/g.65543 Transcript_23377/m.65543 type:complete len:251 (-) Transcript_23377:1349-2101(-)